MTKCNWAARPAVRIFGEISFSRVFTARHRRHCLFDVFTVAGSFQSGRRKRKEALEGVSNRRGSNQKASPPLAASRHLTDRCAVTFRSTTEPLSRLRNLLSSFQTPRPACQVMMPAKVFIGRWSPFVMYLLSPPSCSSPNLYLFFTLFWT